MHGRVKVRTSEEEKLRKEKERNEKLKIFKHAMQKIQSKREKGELDQELLDITGKVLSSNPDIYTLWNMRREALIIIGKNAENEELSKLYDAELQLTEYCLKMNPKSYSAWHQRNWVLITRSDPDWNKELALCNTYLKLDERNFHTWDYRRFVVHKCKPPLKDEFDFTTEKLYDNFSNYSAWHYRSKLLVELYPDLEGGRPIKDSHHKHELKMVQSAAFTDPDDTSAWFYQRWLLGAVKTVTQLIVCCITESKTTLAFSHYVNKEFVSSRTTLLLNDKPVNGTFVSCTGNVYDKLWILNHGETVCNGFDFKVKYETDDGEKKVILCKEVEPNIYVGRTEVGFQKEYSEPVVEELKHQLESCRQLLEFEPDSKWTLLTTTVFLHCIDAKKYHKEVIANLEKLKNIDKLRSGYYNDLITKWNIEQQLHDDYNNDSLKLRILFSEKMTCLPNLQYYSFCKVVDLSNQNVTSNVLPSLVMLQHCKELSLENNQISTLTGFPCLELEKLNLKGNKELANEEVKQFESKCNYSIFF